MLFNIVRDEPKKDSGAKNLIIRYFGTFTV
jgi:hypothetical protein